MTTTNKTDCVQILKISSPNGRNFSFWGLPVSKDENLVKGTRFEDIVQIQTESQAVLDSITERDLKTLQARAGPMYKLRKELETGKYPPVIKLREKCCTVPLLASVSYLCQYKYSFSFQTWNFTFAVLLGPKRLVLTHSRPHVVVGGCHDCIAAMSGSVATEWKVTSSSVNPRYKPGQPTA